MTRLTVSRLTPAPVQVADVGLDLAGAHPARVQGNDLLIQAGQAPLVLGDQLRLKLAFAVAGNGDLDRPVVGQQRLGRATVARVPSPAGGRPPGRVAQMLGELLGERPLDQPSGQLAQQAVATEDLPL